MSSDHDILPEGPTFQIEVGVLRALREALPQVARQTVAAVTAEVAEYRGAQRGPMGQTIERAVQMALAGFLKLAGRPRDLDPSTPMGPTIDGAYALGRGEARGGRSMDGLLTAYRVGARVSWREWARTAADAGVDATTMARFAELLFAYIDGLSAASVAGHSDELTTSGRVRERYRERLARKLLARAPREELIEAAERAGWTPPDSLTAVLLPLAHVHGAVALLGADTLQINDDLPGSQHWGPAAPLTLLLVSDVAGANRPHLLRVLVGRYAVVGPPRPWTQARSSYDRSARTLELSAPTDQPLDSDQLLADLVLEADSEALADLRTLVLAPLAHLPEATRDRLVETLLAWLLHQGRRDEIAEALHVHPQTVRYRMGQVREAYGERLADPAFVRELVIALPVRPGTAD